MKLLLDQNLSHRLVAMLADIFPDSAHVRSFDLQQADDAARDLFRIFTRLRRGLVFGLGTVLLDFRRFMHARMLAGSRSSIYRTACRSLVALSL